VRPYLVKIELKPVRRDHPPQSREPKHLGILLVAQTIDAVEPAGRERSFRTVLIGDLALTDMGLGDKAAAFALSERAMAAIPIEKDALAGPSPIEILARVATRMGNPDRAIAALQKLLSIPYNGALASQVPLTPALLRLDPMFDPLRNDPRFEKIVVSFAPKGEGEAQ
jgi:hypothetical protein